MSSGFRFGVSSFVVFEVRGFGFGVLDFRGFLFGFSRFQVLGLRGLGFRCLGFFEVSRFGISRLSVHVFEVRGFGFWVLRFGVSGSRF